MEHYITKELLEKLANMTDFDKLNSNKVPETFNYQNKCFVPVGSCSSRAEGYITVSCHQLIPLEKYTGSIEPKYSNEHYNLVIDGKRERGYNARLLKLGSTKYVMIDPMIHFKPLKENKQLNLF